MIVYRKGDATNPDISDYRNCLIMHVCNNRGGWGAGFVKALSRRWPQPEAAYRTWHRTGSRFELGQIQVVSVEPNIHVVNMIAQEGYGRFNRAPHKGATPDATPPIRYEALHECLSQVSNLAHVMNAMVVGPKIGSGLAGGDWDRIEAMINETMRDVPVHIYVP